MERLARLSLLAPAVLLACATSSTPAPVTAPAAMPAPAAAAVSETGTPDAPFRKTLPEPGPPVTFKAPVPTVRTLKNGLPVWIVEQHELPLATVELVVRAGEDTDPTGRPGTASFVADMLDEGTSLRDATAIAAAFEDQAALFRAKADKDSLIAAVSFPSASLGPVLDVFSDSVLRPAFKKPDLERVRALRLGDIAQLEADPAQIGRTVLNRTVFGEGHPWAFPTTGTVASTKAARGDELTAWHRNWVRPNNAVLVVVGDVNPSTLLPELERRFGSWKPAALPKRRSLAPVARKGPRVVTVVDRPGAAQSQLWVGELGLGAGSADLYAAQVAAQVLGGGFKSRLNANLRSGKGYTYGAFSAFDVRREPGLFAAIAPVVADKTPEALRELLGEIERLREGGIDAAELADAKSGLIQSLPAEFGSTTSTALAFGKLIALGRPPDYFASYVQKLEAVTREDVAKAARARFDTKTLAIVVVGPLTQLQPRLEALGLGSIALRDATGEAIKAARAVKSGSN
ncbi:MAG TPA: pitrilysin family protein [Myxococcaceae bacterium]|nr:pitrilysin family protein [Myxococcaceae bacterium]